MKFVKFLVSFIAIVAMVLVAACSHRQNEQEPVFHEVETDEKESADSQIFTSNDTTTSKLVKILLKKNGKKYNKNLDCNEVVLYFDNRKYTLDAVHYENDEDFLRIYKKDLNGKREVEIFDFKGNTLDFANVYINDTAIVMYQSGELDVFTDKNHLEITPTFEKLARERLILLFVEEKEILERLER
jgi:hypothetical protein